MSNQLSRLRLVLPLAIASALPAMAMKMMTPTQYIAAAGASDQFEIQSSQLELQSTQDPQIKQFAQRMITDHTKSTQMVQQAAQQAGITAPPAELTPMQQQNMAKLQAASGTDRDKIYISEQKTAHKQALYAQESFAKNGTSAPLKAAAAQIVPVVQMHIQMLKSL